MARALIAIASFFAIFFWIQVISFWLGGYPSDQMVKAGMASFAIGIAVLFAMAGLAWQLVDLFRGNSTRSESIICGTVALTVLPGPLIYVF